MLPYGTDKHRGGKPSSRRAKGSELMIAWNKGAGLEWLAAMVLAGMIVAAVLVAYFSRGLG